MVLAVGIGILGVRLAAGESWSVPGSISPQVGLYAGESINTSIQVAETGEYDFLFEGRLQAESKYPSHAQLRVDVDGATWINSVGDAPTTPQPGGWTLHERLRLTAGNHSFRLFAVSVIIDFTDSWAGTIFYQVPTRVDRISLSKSLPPWVGIPWAGGDVPGFADGPGTQARFGSIDAWAVDASKRLWVADSTNRRIRCIDADGVVTTVAGSGANGDRDGPAHEAEFRAMEGIGVDQAGTAYVAEHYPPPDGQWMSRRYRLRRLSPAGLVDTLFDGTVATGAPTWESVWPIGSYGEQEFIWDRLWVSPAGEIRIEASYNFLEVTWGAPLEFKETYLVLHRLIAWNGAGSFTVPRAEHTPSLDTVTNAAGVVFSTVGDRLLRQAAGELAARTAYRHEKLGRVVCVRGDHVVAVRNAQLIEVAQPPNPAALLTVRIAGGGVGSVLGIPLWPVPLGTTLHLRAVPWGEGASWAASFGGWSGDATSSIPVLDVLMDRDKTLTATFGFTIEVLAGSATVDLDPPGPLYSPGTSVRFTVHPAPGLTAIRWNDGVTNTVREEKVDYSLQLGVVAYDPAAPRAMLRLAAEPGGGGGVNYDWNTLYLPPDTPVRLGATPNPGFQFVGWADGDTNVARVVRTPQPNGVIARYAPIPGTEPTLTVRPAAAAGWLVVQISGVPSARYYLVTSTDLHHWVWYSNFQIPATGPAKVEVPMTSSTGLFIRAVLAGT